jgi:hypothetical protein
MNAGQEMLAGNLRCHVDSKSKRTFSGNHYRIRYWIPLKRKRSAGLNGHERALLARLKQWDVFEIRPRSGRSRLVAW